MYLSSSHVKYLVVPTNSHLFAPLGTSILPKMIILLVMWYENSEVTDNCALRTPYDVLCSANAPAYRAFHYVVGSYFTSIPTTTHNKIRNNHITHLSYGEESMIPEKGTTNPSGAHHFHMSYSISIFIVANNVTWLHSTSVCMYPNMR